jgi:hypothetical protein
LKIDEKNKNNIALSNDSLNLKDNISFSLNIIQTKKSSHKLEHEDIVDSFLTNKIEKDEKFNNHNKDDFLLKNMTNNPMSLDIIRKYIQKRNNEEDDIDVENFSDDNNSDNENKVNDIFQNKSIISKSRTPSASSSRSTSSTRSNQSLSSRLTESSIKSNDSIKFSSDFIDIQSKKNNLNQQSTIVKEQNINKNRRQRFHSNYSSTMQKQNATSILINGKRYYQLKFSCENCGLRYSDQGTLNMHKLNYCSKRVQSNDEIDASKERSRSSSISKKSRSNSPQSNTFSNIVDENETNNHFEIKNECNFVNPETNYENNEFERDKSSDNVNQTKNVIYQCNSCLFQTDKKSIMNKHSRVHLPQKRKAMEESTLQNNNSLSDDYKKNENENIQILKNTIQSNLSDKQNDVTSNEKTNSYCKDCDIQFSSMKTYLHHRNIYCQKYKTIELSPNDAKKQTLISVQNKTSKSFTLSKNKDESKANVSDDDKTNNNNNKSEQINHLSANKVKMQDELQLRSNITIPTMCSSTLSSIPLSKQKFINSKNSPANPPKAVCMGDLVSDI